MHLVRDKNRQQSVQLFKVVWLHESPTGCCAGRVHVSDAAAALLPRQQQFKHNNILGMLGTNLWQMSGMM